MLIISVGKGWPEITIVANAIDGQSFKGQFAIPFAQIRLGKAWTNHSLIYE